MSVFDTLVGQEHMIAQLQGAILSAKNGEETQEMTHAWVFTGPPGSGRSSAAIAFAQALVCPNLGCGTCNACLSAANGGHPDVEIIRTEGLSIKIDEVRELLARVAWAPSMGGWRVVVMEDADRLTESAANALLKAIEDPGNRTVWLLCAPTLHDVLPTIRSRCRHMQLVTPSTKDVAAVLQSRDGISPQMADFAARVSQGHIGRAKYIATNEHVRSNRKVIMNLALHLTNVSEAFKAAQTLVDLATEDAKAAAEIRDEKEQEELAQAYGKGATGRGMATGGSKALKELEKEQKTRTTRMVRDSLDAALLDIATLYRDIMMIQSGHIDSLINIEMAEEIRTLATILPTHRTIQKLDAIMKARKNLGYNAAPLLTIEALMCELRLIAALAISALLLTGCVQEVKPVKLETLQDFQTQPIKWRTCFDTLKCTDVLVPIDYTNIKLGTFKIAVLKHEASNKQDRIGSMFVNPGGPGASGVEYAYGAEYIVSPQLLALYDIVGFDPRGVGRSAPIRCLTDDETDANYASDSKPDNAQEFETLVKEAQDYVAKCEKNTKNLTAYSTENAARDMDVIRAVLGDKKLNYLGKSYGTYLGTIYAQLFPDKVGRVVLDGAIDPRATPLQQSLIQAVGFDNALDAFIKDCLQLDTCPLPKDATKQYFTDLFGSVAKKPLTTRTKRIATESLVVLGTASALYDNESGWPLLRVALKQAKTGNGYMFLSLADAYTGRQLNGTYPTNEGDSGFVIDCLDWNDSRSNEQIAQDAEQFKAQAPVFGPYLSYSGISCKYFSGIKQPIKINQIKTTPIIVIGTLRDPATPYSWAIALHNLITNSLLITLDGDGHTGHGRGSTCVDKTVDTYFITGKLPATDQKCDLSTAL